MGFEKPFTLTKAVLTATPKDSRIFGSSSGLYQIEDKKSATIPYNVRDSVIAGVIKEGPTIVRDYFIEIAVLFIGAKSGVSGLQEFCFLAGFILLYDCLFLFTFYTAMLTLKLEVSDQMYISLFISFCFFSLSLVLVTYLFFLIIVEENKGSTIDEKIRRKR